MDRLRTARRIATPAIALNAETPTTRWAAGVQYDGSRYSGWQSQQDAPSVQAALDAALSKVAAEPVESFCAGRTDAGVHGFAQVVHFNTAAQRSAYAWLLGTNSNLPDDVSLSWVQPVRADFHARHSATARRYRYLIHNSRSRSALLHQRAAWFNQPLDEGAMHRAAQALIGERDFSAFRGSQCQSSTPMRNVMSVSVTRRGELVAIDIRANAFLHHMVRNIAGSLMKVGEGKRPEGWIAELMEARDRTLAGKNAPPCGLYFAAVEYPREFGIPEAPEFWLP